MKVRNWATTNRFGIMSRLIWTVIFVMLFCNITQGYRILVVFPMAGKSHGILGYGIVSLLLKAGHEVTYITSVVENDTNNKLRQINVSYIFDHVPKEDTNLKLVLEQKATKIDHSLVMTVVNKIHVMVLEDENVQKMLNDPKEHYDLVITEWLFSEICAGYAAVFNAPLIWLCSMEPHWLVVRLVGSYLNPAYNSDVLSSNVLPFSLLQRIEELWTQIKVSYFICTQNNQEQKNHYNRLFVPVISKRGRQAPQFDELLYNASLVLSNSHVSIGEATNIPQSFKPVAGYHIAENREPLPKALRGVMDNAEFGVIYFSMGSILRSKDMPNSLKESLVKIFGELKQTVVWKIEEDFTNLPNNLYIVKWAPQQSILSHPKCILFITHGGMLSITETIHFGVPIIGIPVFADQFINIKRAVKKGFAIKVDFTYTMAHELKSVIEDIIKDPKYTKKAKELSLIYHNRPAKPGVELVHWVEHVIKTQGAMHLRSPECMIPWYQKLYLDLVALITVLMLVFIISIKYVITLYLTVKNTSSEKKEK